MVVSTGALERCNRWHFEETPVDQPPTCQPLVIRPASMRMLNVGLRPISTDRPSAVLLDRTRVGIDLGPNESASLLGSSSTK